MNAVLCFICIVFVAIRAVHGQCSEPRVRKSWDNMTTTEHATYIRSIEFAMYRGYHAMFNEIHQERFSEMDAHRTCGFLFWHRRFLIAYENMLRRQAPRFRCVTIPYWNYFQDYAKFRNGDCGNLQSCSNILTGMGGSSGPRRTLNINGELVTGNCVNTPPARYFCETSTRPRANCARCIPRQDWTRVRIPSNLGYASLAAIFNSGAQGFRHVSARIQNGVHNSIHNALRSTLSTFASPADPLFYSHHATIDMLHHIYYECHVGRRMTIREKAFSPMAFERCAASGVRNPYSTWTIRMRWDDPNDNAAAVNAHRHPRLWPNFYHMGTRYYQFVDNLDLGRYSYGYQMDELVSSLMRNGMVCPRQIQGNTLPRRLQEEKAEVPCNTTAIVDDRPKLDTIIEASYPPSKTDMAIENSVEWFVDLASKVNATTKCSTKTLEQLEIMECDYHDKYLGGVDDYTEEFKKAMHITGHARCRTLLNAVKNGTTKLVLPEAERTFVKYFGKPKPVDCNTTGTVG